MKVDMIHSIQIMHPELPQEMRSMLPWWPVAEDSQAVNSMEVFTWLLTLSESWPPLADCTVNDRTSSAVACFSGPVSTRIP